MTEASEICAWLRRVAPAGAELRIDSRSVGRGDIFVAIPGVHVDGRRYLTSAILQGAGALLVESQDWQPIETSVPLRTCAGLAAALGPIASLYYGRPSARLLTIGVTGTNGKTSCTFWIAQLLAAAGRRCGVVGTLGAGFPDGPLESTGLTTPDAPALHGALRRLLQGGAAAVALEVSSIGLDQGRVDAIEFDIALFTNLTRDHLDYHGTMRAYEQAKARLFDWSTLTHAVVNLDDAAGCRYAAAALKRGVHVIGYGLAEPVILRARIEPAAAAAERGGSRLTLLGAVSVTTTSSGLSFVARVRAAPDAAAPDAGAPDAAVPVATRLLGTFNASNLLGAIGVAICAGVPLETACAACSTLQPPPGRMQRVVPDAGAARDPGPIAIVDYAHTPDALEQALGALAPLAAARRGQLWVVFGAGGDRDPGKRAPMGEVAARLADHVVVTSDNPRSEDPDAIIEQVVQGARGIVAELARLPDRAAAIEHALQHAAAADVVLIAGKGHETTQEARGRRVAFSDVEHAQHALAARGATASAVAAPGQPEPRG